MAIIKTSFISRFTYDKKRNPNGVHTRKLIRYTTTKNTPQAIRYVKTNFFMFIMNEGLNSLSF